MATVSLVALKAHSYAKSRLTPGEPFQAQSEQDARVLLALGVAKRAETPAEPMRLRPMPPAPAVPAAPTEAPAATGTTEPASDERRRRTYKRRDLAADE
jgi:hypothetical protein